MNAKNVSIITRMEQSRARLNAVLNKIAPQMEIYPTWKVKQLMDHIAGWDELVYATLIGYLHGEKPSLKVKGGIDGYNAESISARSDISLEQSRQEYDAARQKVLQALREIPPEKMSQKFPAPWGGTCTVNSIVKIFVSHELEHARHIEAVLSQASI